MFLRLGVYVGLWVIWFLCLESERFDWEPKYKSYLWATVIAGMMFGLASLVVAAI